MTATEAAIRVMESEGVELAFGVPGAAILPLYQAMNGSKIKHVLVRHEEGGTHAAEGYTRAASGRIGVCIGTSGPAGTNMITGLYSAIADSIPILCITGQAPRAKLHKEDFQAVDIAAIAKPVTKWATTVMEGAQVPRAFRYAFQLMRSGPSRPGADRFAARRPERNHRVRSRLRFSAGGVQATPASETNRQGARHDDGGTAAVDLRRRRRN